MALYLILVSMFQPAHAAGTDPFYMMRDGYEFYCTYPGNQDPGGVLDCVNKAYSSIYSRSEAAQLCAGAFNDAPATCAIEGYRGIYNKNEAIDLCTRAMDNGPVECAKKAYSSVFNREESIDLCRRTGTIKNAECAIRAYSGIYSRGEAIQMCKSRSASLVSMALAQTPMQIGKTLAQIQKIAKEKAVKLNENMGVDLGL